MNQKVVLITGCSSGIGLALAIRIAKDEKKRFMNHGNAGMDLIGPIECQSIDEMKAVMDTNFFGLVRLLKEVLPDMKKRKEGHIVVISSVMGIQGILFNDIYAASKFAVEGFCESLAVQALRFNLNQGSHTSTESDIYTKPDMPKKVRKRDGDREQRGDIENSVDWEERVVDIYQSVDDFVPGPQEDMTDNTAGRQTQVTANLVAVSGQRSKTERRPLGVVAGCLGMLCLILLGVIIGIVSYPSPSNNCMANDTLVHDNNKLKSNYDNLMREKDRLQSEVHQLNRQISDKSCPNGWKKFGRSCYYITTGEKSWQESREECLNQGADLVVINSGEEQVFINGLRHGGYYSWIGLNRPEGEGRWTWVDGTPLTTQFWYSGYPVDYEDWDCAVYYHTTDTGRLYNGLCSSPWASICEK